LALLIILITRPASAQEAARVPIVDAPEGTPGLGGAIRLSSSPYHGGAGYPDLVPLYLFEGRWFYSHGTEMGVHGYRNKRVKFNVFARYRFLSLDPEDDESLEGLKPREQTTEAGLSFEVKGRWGQVKAAWMADVLDRHNGQQAELSYRRRFDRGRWMLSPYVSLVWQDESMSDYYYGVSANEARPDRPEYHLGNTFSLDYGLNTSYAFTRQILGFANVGFRNWDQEILDSPLVDEGITPTLFLGASYMFGNVYDPTISAPREKEGKWSWRVNYGYQADGNIAADIDHGNFSKSRYVDSRIAGFTYSRLVNRGPRVDFFARAALFRHFEDGQDDMFSFAAYMMALGKGYLSWSDQPFFRWGFGFGFSYAQEVPIVEQIKQEQGGRETNKFLNYLEMTLDFSIDAFTKNRAGKLHGCYTGLTVVHRSGIFATADILGNVHGGSDWITVHLECLR
jgi:outer membrane scaffolding protein for murein synthesis (MipA/OmpV family)